MDTRSRVVLIALLLGSMVVMGGHYETNRDHHWSYPETTDLLQNYEDQLGERVFLFLTIEDVDHDAEIATSRITSQHGELTLSIRGVDAKVQQGGVIQVVGTVRQDNVIDATTVRVVTRSQSSSHYKYAVSVVGAILVLAGFFRHWRFDTSELAFEPR